MRHEETQERAKQQTAFRIYEKLWTMANSELSKARQEWLRLQDQLAEVKMMEFAASDDESVLLPEEQLLLDEMNQKLETAQNTVQFWTRRVEKLHQYRDKVPQFYVRLESDIEMHRLRLDLSKYLVSSGGQRRVRLY